MSASTLVSGENNSAFTGVRQVNIRTDLAAIAELIELSFTVDETGRATARELRALSQSGALLSLLKRLDRLLDGLGQGFVWVEQGRVVANVSIAAAGYPRSLGTGYIIANVAVHPEFRRRGYARAVMQAAIAHIRSKGGNFAVLQVEANNHGAQKLYRELGFAEERTFIRWQRPSHLRPPQKLEDMPYITLRQGNEWRIEYELARVVRPNRLGGLGWLRPTHPDLFRPSFWRFWGLLMSGQGVERWIVRSADERRIVASLRVLTSFGGTARLELLVHPSYGGKLERPLLNFVLRRFDGQARPLSMEHPADDDYTSQVLQEYGFYIKHTLVHMRLDLNPVSNF
ncbi:MAG: hypothetical protein OHK0023_11180 [Anaerolineae bacterium]